jgi:hypothetical protein
VTEDPKAQEALLMKDLTDPAHYVALTAFNGPQFTEEFIAGIEAGKLLVLLTENHPDMQESIVENLTAVGKSPEVPDPARGAAAYFLGKIAPQENLLALKDDLALGRSGANPPILISYLDYYLQKMTPLTK